MGIDKLSDQNIIGNLGGIRQCRLNDMLDCLARQDDHIRAAVDLVGYPKERLRPSNFDTFLRVIIGQQLSVKAAETIYQRVTELMAGCPSADKVIDLDDQALRSVGLSRQKVTYVRSLAQAVITHDLPLDALSTLGDAEAIKAIVTVKGLGIWSAEIYLMFSLGREDIWPADDLAVQVGVARLIGLEARPKPKALREIGMRWKPYRSAAALLVWHYYSKAPA